MSPPTETETAVELPCQICETATTMQALCCGAALCPTCIDSWCGSRLDEGLPLNCATCTKQLNTDTDLALRRGLKPETIERVDRTCVREVLGDELFSCPSCNNFGFAPAGCTQVTCDRCGCSFPERNTSFLQSLGSNILSGAWKIIFTRPCPSCGSLIQKNGGCSHMHCRLCNTHFTWTTVMHPILAIFLLTVAAGAAYCSATVGSVIGTWLPLVLELVVRVGAGITAFLCVLRSSLYFLKFSHHWAATSESDVRNFAKLFLLTFYIAGVLEPLTPSYPDAVENLTALHGAATFASPWPLLHLVGDSALVPSIHTFMFWLGYGAYIVARCASVVAACVAVANIGKCLYHHNNVYSRHYRGEIPRWLGLFVGCVWTSGVFEFACQLSWCFYLTSPWPGLHIPAQYLLNLLSEETSFLPGLFQIAAVILSTLAVCVAAFQVLRNTLPWVKNIARALFASTYTTCHRGLQAGRVVVGNVMMRRGLWDDTKAYSYVHLPSECGSFLPMPAGFVRSSS